jgi:hypothetical protein
VVFAVSEERMRFKSRDLLEAMTGYGERKLLMESLVKEVIIGPNKNAALTLRPSLLGFITPSLALRV